MPADVRIRLEGYVLAVEYSLWTDIRICNSDECRKQILMGMTRSRREDMHFYKWQKRTYALNGKPNCKL